MHFSEPGEQTHAHEEEKYDLENHASETEPGIGCPFLDALNRVAQHLSAEP